MSSFKVFFRLNDQEHKILREIVDTNETTGFDSDADFFRLLLWREHYRRKGLGPPPAHLWQWSVRVKGVKNELEAASK